MQCFRGNFLGNDPSTSQMEETHLNSRKCRCKSCNSPKLCKTDWAFVSTNAYATDLWMQQKSGYDVLKKWPVSQVR